MKISLVPLSVGGRTSPREGVNAFVLLAVLVFVMLLSMIALSLIYSSKAEESAVGASAGSEQAWAVAMSGVESALRVASAATDGSTDWREMPAAFRHQRVGDDGADTWYFSVFSPGDSDQSEVRFGLTDEASRVHLNRPGAADLADIPRMTPELAQAVRRFIGASGNLVWMGTDFVSAAPNVGVGRLMPNPQGSAAEFAPVIARGPLASVGELLEVPGFSWGLLFGEDANFNGRLDPNENDGTANFPPDNQDGQLDHGMAQYFTVNSYETPVTRERLPRMNLNGTSPIASPELPESVTNYVTAMRQAKIKFTHPAELLEAKSRVKDAEGREVEVSSGVGREELPKVLDLLTAETLQRREGLINLNTASALVLATLPEVDLSLAETIVATRTSLSAERRATTAWLYQEGVVDAAKFRQMAPQLTARSFQFQFRVVGYGVPSGRFRVVEAQIDVAGRQRRVTSLKDVTKLGLPFRLTNEDIGSGSGGAGNSRSN